MMILYFYVLDKRRSVRSAFLLTDSVRRHLEYVWAF